MARSTNLNVVKQIGDVDIYEDLAGLPDADAVKRSRMRTRNQAAAARKKSGTVVPRSPKSPSEAKFRKSGATPMPEEAKAIMTRHADEIKAHDAHHAEMVRAHGASRKELEKKHEGELTRVRELVAAIQMVDKIDGTADLSKPLRAELAKIK